MTAAKLLPYVVALVCVLLEVNASVYQRFATSLTRKMRDVCQLMFLLPSSCDGVSEINYLSLQPNLDYLILLILGSRVWTSQIVSLCSSNCSCLGVFYCQNSSSCYMIRDH